MGNAGTVIDLPLPKLLPATIPSAQITELITALGDLTHGMFAGCPAAEDIARRLRLALIALARGEATGDRVLELGLALEAVARLLTAAPSPPATAAADAVHVATLEAAAQQAAVRAAALEADLTHARAIISAVTAERDRAAALVDTINRSGQDASARLAAAERERDTERAALAAARAKLTAQEEAIVAARTRRSAAELDDLRAATEALRTEQAHATEALAKVAAAAADARVVHARIADATHAIITAATGAPSPIAVADRVAIAAAIAERNTWLRMAQDHLSTAADELDHLHREQADAEARIRAGRPSDGDRARRATIAARCAQLEAHAATIVKLKGVVEGDLRTLTARDAAFAALATPLAADVVLPTIPDYPAEPDMATDADVSAALDTPVQDADADPQESPRSPEEIAAAAAMLVALYDIIAQHEVTHGMPHRQRPVGKIARIAGATVAAYRQINWSMPTFLKCVTSRAAESHTAPYLVYRGRIGGSFFNTMFIRTAQPIPDAWRAAITDAERTAFAQAFFAPKPPAPPSADPTSP